MAVEIGDTREDAGSGPSVGQCDAGGMPVGDQRLGRRVVVHTGGGHHPQLGAAEDIGDRVRPSDGDAGRDRPDDRHAGDRQRDAEDGQDEPLRAPADVGQREPDQAHERVPGTGWDLR